MNRISRVVRRHGTIFAPVITVVGTLSFLMGAVPAFAVSDTVAKTGDDIRMIVIAVILGVVALGCIIAGIVASRRKRNKDYKAKH